MNKLRLQLAEEEEVKKPMHPVVAVALKYWEHMNQGGTWASFECFYRGDKPMVEVTVGVRHSNGALETDYKTRLFYERDLRQVEFQDSYRKS